MGPFNVCTLGGLHIVKTCILATCWTLFVHRARFYDFFLICVYFILNKILMTPPSGLQNWRIYFSTSHNISHERLSQIFKIMFDEFAETTKKVKSCSEPIFNVVPVIGAGSSATSMDDIITCELVARKPWHTTLIFFVLYRNWIIITLLMV